MGETPEDIRLSRIDAGRQALSEATSIPEVKDIRDKAEAIRMYFQQQGSSFKAQNQAAELKLRAERKLGQLIPTQIHRGGNPKYHDVTLADLGIEPKQSSRWQREASVDEESFEAYLAETKSAGKELTTADILRLEKHIRQESHLSTIRATDSQTCASSDLNEIISQGMKFGTLYADPPWSYGNQATRASTDNHYPTLTPEQIARDFAPQMHALSAPDAHLHLWTTNAFLFDSKAILEAWGFEYKSVFVWVKPQIGMGNYWRLAHEFLLLGIKGNCPFADRSIKSWLESPRGEHSDKPDEIRKLIETVSPPAYFELFGRRPVENWVVYGNEIDKGLFYQSVEESSTHTQRVPVVMPDSTAQLRLVQ